MTRIIAEFAVAAGSSLVLSLIVKTTIVMGAALVAVCLARRTRASVRHLVLAASFVVLLTLPVVATVADERTLIVPISTPSPTAATTLPAGSRVGPNVALAGDGGQAAKSAPIGPSPTAIVLAVWATGAIIFFVPVIAGLMRVHRMRRDALRWCDGEVTVSELASTLGIRRRIQLLLDDEAIGPMTCGVVRAVIVMPPDARTWEPADLRRALVHELEHIRRLDWLMLCVAQAGCAVYWFHPLVWIARRRLRLEAERACDDAVLAGGDAETYADQLVTLAQRFASHPSPSLLTMASAGDLSARVSALLDAGQQRGRAGARAVVTMLVIAVLLVLGAGPLRTVGRAQDGPAPAFDVATIKPTPELNAGDFEPSLVQFTAGGRFRRTNSTLRTLVRTAYGVHPYQVAGGPEWADSNRYDIEALGSQGLDPSVAMSANPNRAQILRMLQTLLIDRFKLRVRRDTREGDLYHLVVAGRGPKLERAAESTSATVRIGFYTGHRTTAQLADYLGSIVGRPVTDRTGLTGVFDMQLKFTQALDDPSGVSVFAALPEQLGLQLESARGPVETYVILDAQPPSGN